MALVLLDGQGVNFTDEGGCFIDTRTYRGRLHETDCTQFQVRLTEANGTELVSNGDFVSGLTGWTASGAVVNFEQCNLVGVGAYIEQTITLEANSYYQLSVEIIENPDNATLLPTFGTIVFSNGQDGNFQSLGTSVIYFETGATTSDTLSLVYPASGFMTIDNVSIKKLTTPSVEIQECDGTYVSDADSVEYSRDYANITHCWNGFDEGCYRIAMTPEGDEGTNLFSRNSIVTTSGKPIVAKQFSINGVVYNPITWTP